MAWSTGGPWCFHLCYCLLCEHMVATPCLGRTSSRRCVHHMLSPIIPGLDGSKSERVGAVQPGEEKALGAPYCGLSVLKGGL